MKLKAIHLFLIILLVLILCCGLGSNVTENMDDRGRGYVSNNNNNSSYSSASSSGTSSASSSGTSSGLSSASSSGTSSGLSSASSSEPPQACVTKNSYTSPNGNSADVYSTTNSKVVVTPNGEQILADTNNTVYGVSQHQIPAGQEDLYILKSQIVPPVCPACPSPGTCNSGNKCPACPACARCPEPAFECKKVPNYQTSNTRYLPRPVLSDFSQFGM